MTSMKPKESSTDPNGHGSGHLHAKLVNDAESVLCQFSLPVCSTKLIDEVMNETLSISSGPAQWSAYHQLVNVQRLQLESLFDCVLGFSGAACTGLKGAPGAGGPAGSGYRSAAVVRSDILRSILLSLASLTFLRLSTTITMATHGPHLVGPGPRVNGAISKMQLGSARLVNEEGLASLKADCELIVRLITQLTAPPGKKTAKPDSE
ncbi:hypothetical protein GE21DRAFT_8883 [Neurospora crassa]|uniref:Uncharacterized protein n=1 Tax=Neurospora crassa (strain ATCC 24698 / 74-OR23-1A / CBS 708.71 / DSM 1257 / FGSC 987) TaxID=367110 RepID=Q7S5X7_NEUCR|nr:hypothetical protein NCU05629 [Neurospora crassa OR74A]EAA30937.2 hypothetical protein NCU05629 [Neurospora crassa OR74A]KHE80569.1 hypothetical protein GE21DRAFT_8883 [Neurospora crassa]|eukprot:XP_960173.2 hypothetical protein NCU05629 [Neurospora crassa OR74A]